MSTSKILINLCLTKQKTKTKNAFVNIVVSVLAHNEISLKMNGKQTVNLKSGLIELKIIPEKF